MTPHRLVLGLFIFGLWACNPKTPDQASATLEQAPIPAGQVQHFESKELPKALLQNPFLAKGFDKGYEGESPENYKGHYSLNAQGQIHGECYIEAGYMGVGISYKFNFVEGQVHGLAQQHGAMPGFQQETEAQFESGQLVKIKSFKYEVENMMEENSPEICASTAWLEAKGQDFWSFTPDFFEKHFKPVNCPK